MANANFLGIAFVVQMRDETTSDAWSNLSAFRYYDEAIDYAKAKVVDRARVVNATTSKVLFECEG